MRSGKLFIASVIATAAVTACKSRSAADERSIAGASGGESGDSELINAKGGTAKPPVGKCVQGVCPALVTPQSTIFSAAGPLLPVAGAGGSGVPAIGIDNGFDMSGMLQAVTVTGGCSGTAGQTSGGSVTINGVVIQVPSNTIVQFPANTLTFADGMCPQNNGINGSALAFNGSGGTPTPATGGGQATPVLPSVEMHVVGNIVSLGNVPASKSSPHIAALMWVTQQTTNSGSGYIASIDYNDGSIYVASNLGHQPGGYTRLLINDPIGRYGRPQSSPDARFSVDTANPTIKAGATGYPMCVPRKAPSGNYAVENDPRCPQRNRPTGVAPSVPCRTFVNAGLTGQLGNLGFAGPFRIPGADISPTPISGFCHAFVMKAIQGMPGTINPSFTLPPYALIPPAGAINEPDAREQVPFEVGDFITWQGTLVRGGNTPPANASFPTTTGDVIWVHTIDADVGVYTQPRTLPAYIAIGAMTIGVDPQPTGAAVLGIETTARVSLEASTTDVGSIVDLYYDDKGFELAKRAQAQGGNYVTPSKVAGAEYYRWLTPESMTGSLGNEAGGKMPFATTAQPFGGGIMTQYTGPQPGRARIRAIKVPAINPAVACQGNNQGNSVGCAVTQSPTRYIRAVIRSLCAPGASGALDNAAIPTAVPASNLDAGNWYDVNGATGAAPKIVSAFPGGTVGSGPSTITTPADGANPGTCLERAQFANGLYSGQYMAPIGEYIFPENTLAGRAVVPVTAHQLGFLVYGEGGLDGASSAPQSPKPW